MTFLGYLREVMLLRGGLGLAAGIEPHELQALPWLLDDLPPF